VLPTLELVSTNVYDQEQLKVNLRGCDAVINLVGILNETGHDGAGFRRAHVELPEKIVAACQANQIPRLLHLSALHADAKQGPSHYLRTKGEGEDVIHASGLNVTSFQPSVMFGEDDSFFNQFVTLLRLSATASLGILPVTFMLPCASAKFAPVWVEDVIDVMVQSLEESKYVGQRYPLCGPKVYTLQELVAYTAQLIHVKPLIVPLNDKLSTLTARIMEYVPGKPFSMDNYLSSQVDSVCSENHFPSFGIEPHSIEAVMPRYFTYSANKAKRYSQFRHYARR
jgi:NADH dehydrogenase